MNAFIKSHTDYLTKPEDFFDVNILNQLNALWMYIEKLEARIAVLENRTKYMPDEQPDSDVAAARALLDSVAVDVKVTPALPGIVSLKLTKAQRDVLEVVNHQHPGKVLHRTSIYMRLMERGLIERNDGSPRDGYWRLTDLGRRALKAAQS